MSRERIAVAMSGGIDSSVAAALLKRQGADLLGLTIRRWGNGNGSNRDIEDAQKVADLLGIPHRVIEMDGEFESHVVDYFVREYRKGRTPNPCAVCNPAIKFGALMRIAESEGRRLATGHYAAVRWNPKTRLHELRRGKDRQKDQSYFLSRLSQDSLSRAVFPVGSCSKKKVRQLAGQMGLPVSEKEESQEVCFVPEGDVPGFIRSRTGGMEPGPILDMHGATIGKHTGIAGLTIGQRKGLGIAVGKPMYVFRIDPESNTVIMAEDHLLYQRRFLASDCHWISIPEPKKKLRARIQIRYLHKPAKAFATLVDGGLDVIFDKPQRAITPGQLAVLYDRDRVLGSAWIDTVLVE